LPGDTRGKYRKSPGQARDKPGTSGVKDKREIITPHLEKNIKGEFPGSARGKRGKEK